MSGELEARARFILAARKIDRDALLNDLTDEEMDALIEAVLSTSCVGGLDVGEGWQDIETAPKDGTEVLVWRKAGLAAVAAYMTEPDTFAGPRFHSGWCVTDGMWLVNVTHWKPLPAPPLGKGIGS